MCIFVTDNSVLFALNGGNDVFHLFVGIGTEFLLQDIIMDGQGTFYHIFHFTIPDAVLPFQGNLPFYLSGRRDIGSCS